MAFELLESRTLLAATLDIASGALTYGSTSGINNNLTIETTGPTGSYTFTDSATRITLTVAAITAGWSGSGTHTVTGPDSSVTSITTETGDGNDAVTVQSADASVSVVFTNLASDVDTVTIGGAASKGATAINGSVSVTNTKGTTVLVVDDSLNTTKPVTVSMSSTKITGLLQGTTSSGQPNPIDVSKTSLQSVTYDEGEGTTLTISSTAKVTTTINTWKGSGAANVTNLQSDSGPVTINAQGTDTITLGAAPQGAQYLKGPVTLGTSHGGTIATLNVDDSADTVGQSATISSTQINGLAPSTIDYSAASLDNLNVKGGQGGNTFSVDSLPDAIVTLNTGAGATINPGQPNPNTVDVHNTTDAATMNLLDINGQGEDTIKLDSSVGIDVTGSTKLLTVSVPMTINAAGSNDDITITNSAASTGSINGAVQIQGATSSSTLTIDDSSDTTARVVLVSDGAIGGLLPASVYYTPDELTSLTLIGAGRLDTLNVNADKQGPVSVTAGTAVGSGTIAIDSEPPLNYENISAVNVTNAADLPLTINSDTVVTSTGDLPIEGKSFPYLVTSFLDADVNARSSNYTAMINWGDGSATSPGSISSQGIVNGEPLFDVTASHLYEEAGSYSVTVTITDLGTGAVPAIIGGIPVTVTDLGSAPAVIASIAQVNLVSDGSIPTPSTDPNLVDPWGIAASPSGYLWAGDNATNVATLYDGSGTPQSLVVSIPGGSPTGVAFNPYASTSPNEFVISSGSSSGPATVVFASLSGEITGWNANVPPPAPSTSAQVAATVAGAEFTGLAMATNAGSDFLYAADFHDDEVDVFDSNFDPVGSFTDATLPAGYAPYNIANIGGDLYVTFAMQDAAKENPVPGLGNGYVDVFSPAGVLLDQLIANGPLDEPWGIALAPSDSGQFSGDLLVANHGNGQIDAFDPTTGALVGPFLDSSGVPVSIDGLRGLSFGNGGSAGATNTLYFTAGPVGGAHGLLGSLTPQVLQTGPTSVVSTATIMEAALKASVVNVSAVEGNPFVGVVANFTDDNVFSQPSDYTATINWGDGSPPTTGTVLAGNTLGSYIVEVGLLPTDTNAKVYTEETGGADHPQPFNITVTITENDGGTSVTADGFANVADAALVPGGPINLGSVFEGTTPAGVTVATFSDADTFAPATGFLATIDWGDGTAGTGVVSGGGGSFIVTGTKPSPYLKIGPAEIKVSVLDIGGKSASMVADLSVIDAPLVAGPSVTLTGTEGQPLLAPPNASPLVATLPAGVTNTDLVTVATFTDSNPYALATDATASIDWGDGTSGAGTVVPDPAYVDGVNATFDVLGSHKYTEVGTYNLIVTVSDSGGDVGGYKLVIDPTAEISDGILAAGAGFPAITTTVGARLNNIGIGLFSESIPNFVQNVGATEPDSASDFSVSIDWRDGISTNDTTTGSVSVVQGTASGTTFKVSGSYQYTTAGTFTVTATITDVDTDPSQVSVSTTITVNPTKYTLTAQSATANLPEGVPEEDEVVATFTDSNPNAMDSDFTVSFESENPDITATPSGTPVVMIGGGNGTPTVFKVLGDLSGDDSGNGDVERDGGALLVTITDTTTNNVASVSSQVYLYDPVLIDPPSNVQAVAGTAFQQRVASFSTTDQRATPNDFTAVIDWGDGQSSNGAIVSNGSAGFLVIGDHGYAQPGAFVVTTTISDLQGQSVSDAGIATVAAAPIVAQGLTIAPTERKSFSGRVATFISPIAATAGEFSALINWGDGSSSTGVVVATGSSTSTTTFAVFGEHTYARSKHASGTVTIVESGGGQTAVPFTSRTSIGRKVAVRSHLAAGKTSQTDTLGRMLGSTHPKGPRVVLKSNLHVPTTATDPGASR